MKPRTIWLTSLAGALLAPWAAHADILQCKDASGQVTYTQGSCPPGTQPVTNGAAPVSDEVCPPTATMAAKSSWDDIRACSRSRSLPSTAQWAQVKDGFEGVGERRRWTGDYLCLKQVQTKDAQGAPALVRPSFTVSSAMVADKVAPGFQVRELGSQVFPTKVAAVEAGCAAKAK